MKVKNIEEKEIKKIRGSCEGKHERGKNEGREGKILYIPRTRGTYIKSYRLSRVIKISSRTQHVISIY